MKHLKYCILQILSLLLTMNLGYADILDELMIDSTSYKTYSKIISEGIISNLTFSLEIPDNWIVNEEQEEKSPVIATFKTNGNYQCLISLGRTKEINIERFLKDLTELLKKTDKQTAITLINKLLPKLYFDADSSKVLDITEKRYDSYHGYIIKYSSTINTKPFSYKGMEVPSQRWHQINKKNIIVIDDDIVFIDCFAKDKYSINNAIDLFKMHQFTFDRIENSIKIQFEDKDDDDF